MARKFQPETRAVRESLPRSQYSEHSEALYLTSSYVFDNAAQAAARFSGEEEGDTYSRFTNPTVSSFQMRLAALEEGEACLASASGMSSIFSLVMAFCRTGDHIVASTGLFGATQKLLGDIIARFGIRVSFVSPSDAKAWEAAVCQQTRLFFLETPSNPLTEISDIALLAELAHANGIRLAVDNTFCTPVLQQPLSLGADLVVHSATKFIDGQGRVLGGAVVGAQSLIDEIFMLQRTIGPTLSPFNAWVLLKGLETLKLRLMAQSANALELACWLESHPKVARVFHPGLASHPQHDLAGRQQKTGGSIVAFEVKGAREAAWKVIDRCELLSITSNLGDVKTTLTHPATTTHSSLSAEQRARSGITEALLRISVGLEATVDLQADLEMGLSSI